MDLRRPWCGPDRASEWLRSIAPGRYHSHSGAAPSVYIYDELAELEQCLAQRGLRGVPVDTEVFGDGSRVEVLLEVQHEDGTGMLVQLRQPLLYLGGECRAG